MRRGVGWVYQYAVLSDKHNLAELRTMQDWYLRYQLTKAHGVAEVASVGGFVQQYQVTVDPVKLRAYGIPLSKVSQVIRDSNRDVGGRVVEMAETEYMVRGRGYLRGIGDIENLVVKSGKRHAGADARHRPRRTGAGRAARHRRTQRRRRSGVRASPWRATARTRWR